MIEIQLGMCRDVGLEADTWTWPVTMMQIIGTASVNFFASRRLLYLEAMFKVRDLGWCWRKWCWVMGVEDGEEDCVVAHVQDDDERGLEV